MHQKRKGNLMPTTLTLKKNPFLKTLKSVVQNITSQNAIPVLKYVYFDVQADKLVLKSSNATTTLEKAMPVEEDLLTIDGQPTTLLIDAKFFLTVANSLNSDDITLIVDDTKKTITLKTPSTEMDLKGLDAEQYPRIKEINNQEAISLDTKDLIQALNETVVSVSKQESRPILTGVHLRFTDTHFIVEATDSHILSQKRLPKPENAPTDLDLVLPSLAVKQLQQLTNDKLFFTYDDSSAIFTSEDTTLTTRLIEGNYPDVDRLLGGHYTRKTVMDRAELHDTVKRAQIVLSNSEQGRAQLDTNGVATLTAKTPDNVANLSETLTTFTETLDDEEPQEFTICFNPSYMVKLLATLKSDLVNIDFMGPVRPMRITPQEDDSLIHLLTPIRKN